MSKSNIDVIKNESRISGLDQLPFQISSTSTIDHEVAKGLPKSFVLLKKRKAKQWKAAPQQRFQARQKYFTDCSKINKNNKKNLDDEPSPFSYPKGLDELAHRIMTKAWRNDSKMKYMKGKYFQKSSYQGRQKADLLNRLYVEEPTIDSMKAILDIDPQFFKVIEGRPISDTITIQEYIETNRECLRTRIITGYREDDITLIEENLVREQNMIDTIQENYQKYVNIFEEFLYEDHSSAMILLKTSEDAANEAYDMYGAMKAFMKKYDAAKSSLYNSEQKWRNCKLYQKFLHNISPISWRHERSNFASKRISVYVCQNDKEDESDIFGQFRESLIDREPSLNEILDAFREEIRNDGPAEIYFTEPDQLMGVFQYMQMQNLNSLLYTEEMAIPLTNIKVALKDAEKLFDNEINTLREEISLLEGGIRWEEKRARFMDELGKSLIDVHLKPMIMDTEALNLHVFVEDVYETRVGSNDANLTMLEMMTAIEEKYRNELLNFDKIPSDQVALLEGSCYQEQMAVMQLAEMAAKQYSEMEKLNYRLTKAFEPPFKKGPSKEPKKRSPPVEPPKVVVLPPRNLTDAEEEYLEYFTDFCKYTDDPKNYGIDISAPDPFQGLIRGELGKTTNKHSRMVSMAKGVAALEDVIRANT